MKVLILKRENIIEITLLSIEEYKAAKKDKRIMIINDWWWLRSPGAQSVTAACVVPDGSVSHYGLYIYFGGVGVRPALRIDPTSLNLQIGEKAQYGGYMFTCIAEDMLLCDEIICKMPFRKDWQTENGNNYEASDVKAFLDKWPDEEKKTVIEKQVISYVKTAIEITEITLLSVEEYRAAKDNIPPLDEWWWLRSPGFHSFDAACVVPGGVFGVSDDVLGGSVGVRPALRINPKSLDLQIGDKVRFCGRIWTYIAEGILLCDEIICKMSFRRNWRAKDANDYEKSDVKAFLDKWLEDAKHMSITQHPRVLGL